MNKYHRLMGFVGSLGLGLALIFAGLLSSSQAAAKDYKFGVVNVQEVLDSVEQGKKAKDEMEKALLNRKRELEKRQTEFKKLEEDYEKQKLILSPEALNKKREALDEKKAELQKYYMEAQQEMQKKELGLTKDILKNIRAIIEKIGHDQNYSFIWEKNEGGLIYHKEAKDLTTDVIKEYNKTYK